MAQVREVPEGQFERPQRNRGRESAQRFANYGCMTLLAVFFLFPLAFMFASSFKPERLIFSDLQTVVYAFIPRGFTTRNYETVFASVPFWRYMFNSVFITLMTVGLGLFVNSMIAYALARLRWRGRSLVLSLIVALIIVPLEAIAVPMLVVVNALPWADLSWGAGPSFLGVTLPALTFIPTWLDSYQVQIVPFIANAFSIFLFYQFFLDIPKEFDEAAIVDGASPFDIYWRIIVPLARPTFATVAILESLSVWSAYLWPLMTTRGATFRPLTVGITALYLEDIQWGPILAFAAMVTIPVLALFLSFQRWFIQSVASSGVKG